MPKVSICIPAYEQPTYFKRSLIAALEQDYRDFEIVVTDDSRGNEIAALCEEAHDPRIRYFRNPTRKGSPANWNIAVDHAQGELIKMMHHDDWFASPYSLRRFVRLMDAVPGAALAFSASASVDPNRHQRRVYSPLPWIERLRDDPRALLVGNWIGAPSATIFRSSVRARFDETLRWVVDLDFYLAVLTRAPAFAYDPEPLVCITDGADHQVTRDVASDPNLELSEWFRLYARWAPRPALRDERAAFIARLISHRGLSWRDYKTVGLNGRAARLFANAVIRQRLSRLA
jgi:glycosyltransferase involved in cell wall biosynthesis